MKWIGHTEFGPNYIPIQNQNLNFPNDLEINHWIEQWYLTYSNAFQSLKNKSKIYFISYILRLAKYYILFIFINI